MFKADVLHSSHALRLSGALPCRSEDGIEKTKLNEV
jgi:hypothetical protein